MQLPKKPKKMRDTGKKEGYAYKKTAPKAGAEKKPKQYKTKEQRVADYEELPVIVRFEI